MSKKLITKMNKFNSHLMQRKNVCIKSAFDGTARRSRMENSVTDDTENVRRFADSKRSLSFT